MTPEAPRPALWSPALWFVLTAAVLLAGCAGRRALSPDEHRALLPALQERVAAAPGDARAHRALGEALAQAGEYDRAYEALRRAERLDPEDPRTYYYLGLTEEALGNWAEALARYQDAPRSSPYWRRMGERAVWLRREVARADVAAALNAEGSRAVGVQGGVAVLAFEYRGDDPLYRPLARALSELLAADLAAVGRVPVVESAVVHALTDALDLRPTDLDDVRARRLARLLGVDHVVVGAVEVRDGSVDIEVVPISPGQGPSPKPPVVSGPLSDLFQLEAELVVGLGQALGVQLSPPERERISRPPTEDLQAFLLYSRGLLEEDAGRFAAAAALYAEAASLDPGFLTAAEKGMEAEVLGAGVGRADVALAALGTADVGAVAEDLMSGRLATISRSMSVHVIPGEGGRHPAAEVALSPPPVDPFPAPPPPPTTGGN